MKTFRLAVLAATLVLAGCATREPPRRAEPVRPSRTLPPVRSIAVSPAEYVGRAASTSLLIIRASEFVSEREGPSALGNEARRVRADHEGIGAQLSLAGRRLNLLPSATLRPAHQLQLDALQTAADPGRAYVELLGRTLPPLLTLHDQYRRLGTSPTLRPVAGMATPVIQREVERIRRF